MRTKLTDKQERLIDLNYGSIGNIVVSNQGNPAPDQAWLLESEHATTLDTNHILAVPTDDGIVTFFITLAPDVRSDMDMKEIVDEVGDVPPMTERPIARLWKLEMLCNTANTSRPVPIAPVYYASAMGADFALGVDQIPLNRRLPVGVIQNGNGQLTPISLDIEYILGQQGVHANWGGLSGLSGKTSKKALVEHAVLTHRKQFGLRCAVVVFATKGTDDLFRDLSSDSQHEFWQKHPELQQQITSDSFLSALPQKDSLSDYELYKILGLPPTPFESMRLYVPCGDDKWWGYRTPETNGDLGTAEIFGFEWSLRQVAPYMTLFASTDTDDKLRAMEAEVLHVLNDGYWVSKADGKKEKVHIHDLADLEKFFEYVTSNLDKDRRWKGLHVATIARVRAHYLSIFRRAAQVVSPVAAASNRSLPLELLKDGMLWVIDLSQLKTEAKTLVLYKLITELHERMQSNQLPLDRLILDVDELNQLAPRRGGGTQAKLITSRLQDISERARTDGVILFTAQQTLSEIDERVQANFVTCFFGMTGKQEAREAVYGFSEVERYVANHLRPNEAILQHPVLSHRIKIQMPRPPFLRGKEGQRLLKAAKHPNDPQRILRLLAGHQGRVVPALEQIQVYITRVMQAGGTLEDIEQAARKVGLTAPLEGERNTAEATFNLLYKIISQQASSHLRFDA